MYSKLECCGNKVDVEQLVDKMLTFMVALLKDVPVRKSCLRKKHLKIEPLPTKAMEFAKSSCSSQLTGSAG